MKARWMVPPVAALVIVTVASGLQRGSIHEVEERTAMLRKAIVRFGAREPGAGADGMKGQVQSPAQQANKPIDWKEVARKVSEARNGREMGDIRTMLRLHKQLQELSAADLGAALDGIAALDLPDQGRMMLQQMLVGLIVEKSPEELLKRFADKIGLDGDWVSWQLARAITGWAKANPDAATAWLDQQIAAGNLESTKLDGRSPTRLRFETALVEALIGQDPDAAKARVLALPEDQRQQLLGQLPIGQVGPKQYVELVRGSLSNPLDVSSAIANAASSLRHQGGLERVGRFLDESGATPAERAVVVEQAATTVSQQAVKREDVERMREWVINEAPGSENRLAGKMLANAVENSRTTGFSAAAAMVADFHQSTGSDDVLVGFLSERNIAPSNWQEARQLAEKISNPQQREAILMQLQP